MKTNRLNSTAAPWAIAPGETAPSRPPATTKSQRPARPADLVADLAVPLAQALVTGGLIAGVVVGLLWSVATPRANPWAAWGGLALGVATVAWLILLGQTRRLLWAVERSLAVDLNGDGQVGRPAPAPPTLRVEVSRPDRRQMQIIDLPIEPRAAAIVARGVLGGRPLSEGAWSGRGGVCSRPQFGQFRATLLERGLARWKNPQAHAQGLELTAAGRAVFRSLAAYEGD